LSSSFRISGHWPAQILNGGETDFENDTKLYCMVTEARMYIVQLAQSCYLTA